MDGYIIQFDWNLVIGLAIQLFNVLLMFVILTWLLHKPVSKFMKDRTNKIAASIEAADAKVADAEGLKAQYAQKLQNIELEKTKILEAAKKHASETEQQIIVEAKKEADVIKNRALLEIKREQDKSKDFVKTQIIEISSLIASKYIQTAIDEQKQNQLFEEVISDMGDAKWLN